MKNKKLYRSNNNKILFGVCGGLGEYLNIDPNIIRLLWLLLFPSFFVYIIMAFILPIK
jgi:phage shock protein PspC (stress-responsive transcriptional regulator)